MASLTTSFAATLNRFTPTKITFQITHPSSPLYLGFLSITPIAPSPAGLGKVNPNPPPAPPPLAQRTLNLGYIVFNAISTFVYGWLGGFQLDITYDTDTFVVSEFDCAGVASQVEPALRAIQMQLGPGNVNAELNTLNETAKALLHAITHFTKVISVQQRLLESEPPASMDSEPAPRLDSALDGPEAS